MRRLAIVVLVLLAGCSGPSTAKPTSSPTASATATPIAMSTACPAAGKAAAAIMVPVTLGNNPALVYLDEPPVSGGPDLSSLTRYEPSTASRTEILKSAISEAQVSPDGHWIAFATVVSGQPVLQVVRTDGQSLQTLYCREANQSIGNILWSTDQKSLLFSAADGSTAPPIYLLDLQTGKLQTEVQNNQLSIDFAPLAWLDGNRALLIAHPLGVGPGIELRILDISRGANQQASDLPSVMSSLAECLDADTDGTSLYTSQCNGAFSDQGGGTLRGPSSIAVQSLTGGQKRVVFTSPTLAVTQVRAVGSNQLLLAVGNQDPARSSAASMNGLWKVNTDGSGLLRLVASAGKQGQFAVFSARTTWANVSRDTSLYAFQLSGVGKPPSYSLIAGPMAGGQPTTIASRADGGLLLVVGWTTS